MEQVTTSVFLLKFLTFQISWIYYVDRLKHRYNIYLFSQHSSVPESDTCTPKSFTMNFGCMQFMCNPSAIYLLYTSFYKIRPIVYLKFLNLMNNFWKTEQRMKHHFSNIIKQTLHFELTLHKYTQIWQIDHLTKWQLFVALQCLE